MFMADKTTVQTIINLSELGGGANNLHFMSDVENVSFMKQEY